MSTEAQLGGYGVAAAVPQSVGELLAAMVGESLKSFVKKIPLMVLLFFLGLIVHAFLVVGPNDGFHRSLNFIGDILSTRQNTWGGILVWTLGPALVMGNIRRARHIGSNRYVSSFGGGLTWVRESYAALGDAALLTLLCGAMAMLAVVALLRNNLLGLLLAACLVSALASWPESFWFYFIRLAWTDLQRGRKKREQTVKPFNSAVACVATAGGVAGGLLGLILPGVRQYGWFGFLLFAVLLGVLLFVHSSQQKNRQPPVTLLLALLLAASALLAVALPVYADDGGWAEAGGNFGDWLGSEGSIRAVAQGVLPTFGLIAGSVVGTLGSAAASGAAVTATTPFKTTPTRTPAQTIEIEGDLSLLTDELEIPSLWTYGAPADVVKFTGEAADNLREICKSEDRVQYALAALLVMHSEGWITRMETSKDLDGFLRAAARDEAPAAVADELIGIEGFSQLVTSAIQYWQINNVMDHIANSTGDVYVVFPNYPQYQIATGKTYGQGTLFAVDDLTPDSLAEIGPEDVLYISILDEAQINPDGLTLGKANYHFPDGYVPVPNKYVPESLFDPSWKDPDSWW